MEHSAWLTGSLIYLAAAVIAVPLARFLKLGSIIGYLAAGILIGPWGLKFVTNPQDMLIASTADSQLISRVLRSAGSEAAASRLRRGIGWFVVILSFGVVIQAVAAKLGA